MSGPTADHRGRRETRCPAHAVRQTVARKLNHSGEFSRSRQCLGMNSVKLGFGPGPFVKHRVFGGIRPGRVFVYPLLSAKGLNELYCLIVTEKRKGLYPPLTSGKKIAPYNRKSRFTARVNGNRRVICGQPLYLHHFAPRMG